MTKLRILARLRRIMETLTLPRLKRLSCRLRRHLQPDIDEHRVAGHIDFTIECALEGPVRSFVDWMAFKVGITESRPRKEGKAAIQISISGGPTASSVRMKIKHPLGFMQEIFSWNVSNQRTSDIAMRRWMLKHLETIFAKMPKTEVAEEMLAHPLPLSV